MDDPRIIKLQKWGIDNDPCPCCPVCGEECYAVYIGIEDEICGCDECIKEYLGVATCPVCGMKCEALYMQGGEIIGCDECCVYEDALERDECFKDKKEEW